MTCASVCIVEHLGIEVGHPRGGIGRADMANIDANLRESEERSPPRRPAPVRRNL